MPDSNQPLVLVVIVNNDDETIYELKKYLIHDQQELSSITREYFPLAIGPSIEWFIQMTTGPHTRIRLYYADVEFELNFLVIGEINPRVLQGLR